MGLPRLLRPLALFLQIESSSGIVLLACTFAALVLANSAWAAAFAGLWNIEIGVDFALKKSLLHWINDGLMTLFFFVVGLEIKREFVSGELSELKKAMLPLVAAAGGMVAPAAIYLGIHGGQPTARGWGVPTATDIAFDGAHLDEAKVGILAGSALSAIVGVCLLLWFLPKSAPKGPTDHLPSA